MNTLATAFFCIAKPLFWFGRKPTYQRTVVVRDLSVPDAAHPFRAVSLMPQPLDEDCIAVQISFDYSPWISSVGAKLLISAQETPANDRTMVWLDVSSLIRVWGWTMVHRLDKAMLPRAAIEIMLSPLWKPEVRTYRLELGGFEIGRHHEVSSGDPSTGKAPNAV